MGMLAEIASAYPVVRETFENASDVLGFDLWKLTQEGPEEELNRTENTQPALLTASVALWRVWDEEGGPTPTFLAGHSLGEYTALTCAQALSFEDAVSVVAERGRLMQEAVPMGVGAMAAILGLEDEVLRTICVEAAQGEVVEPVNFNAPGQVVIAGHAAAVERAIALASEAGAKRAVSLPVSVPSHCRLMEPAAEKLAQRLSRIEIQQPALPVVQNVDGEVTNDPAAIREKLCRQLHQPVLWVDSVRYMVDEGVTTIVECGPGKVLTGLCKRISREVIAQPFFDTATLEKAIERCEEES
ncbi:MAG: ACP S-malonyltransferase [Gammaproteobacteria bacterium]